MKSKVPVIIDTDIGGDIDDALALAFALNSPELDLRAVTTVNTDPAMRARIATKMLGTFGREDVYVAPGEKLQFDGSPTFCKDINQAVLISLEDTVPTSDSTAIEIIVETVRKCSGRMNIIGIGCWTNIARAFAAEPSLSKQVERLVLMGGQLSPPGPESNVSCDPGAAAFVLDLPVSKLLVPLDVTAQCRYAAHRHCDLSLAEGRQPKLVRDLMRAWQLGRHNGNPRAEPVLHDPLAVAIAFDPSLIRQLDPMRVTVSRGSKGKLPVTISAPGPPNADVVQEVDRLRFEELFAKRIMS